MDRRQKKASVLAGNICPARDIEEKIPRNMLFLLDKYRDLLLKYSSAPRTV